MVIPTNLIINTDMIDAVNAGEDLPDEVTLDDGTSFAITYHATDAWRGYHEATAADGFTKQDDGWITGDYDDAPAQARSSNVEAKLLRLAKSHPENTYVVIFTPTSNVFATSYDVFVREGS